MAKQRPFFNLLSIILIRQKELNEISYNEISLKLQISAPGAF